MFSYFTIFFRSFFQLFLQIFHQISYSIILRFLFQNISCRTILFSFYLSLQQLFISPCLFNNLCHIVFYYFAVVRNIIKNKILNFLFYQFMKLFLLFHTVVLGFVINHPIHLSFKYLNIEVPFKSIQHIGNLLTIFQVMNSLTVSDECLIIIHQFCQLLSFFF